MTKIYDEILDLGHGGMAYFVGRKDTPAKEEEAVSLDRRAEIFGDVFEVGWGPKGWSRFGFEKFLCDSDPRSQRVYSSKSWRTHTDLDPLWNFGLSNFISFI